MAAIAVERTPIIRPGEPPQGFMCAPADDGTVVFTVWADGVRTHVKLSTEEAVQTGVGSIMAAGEAARRLAATRPVPPAVQSILNGIKKG